MCIKIYSEINVSGSFVLICVLLMFVSAEFPISKHLRVLFTIMHLFMKVICAITSKILPNFCEIPCMFVKKMTLNVTKLAWPYLGMTEFSKAIGQAPDRQK